MPTRQSVAMRRIVVVAALLLVAGPAFGTEVAQGQDQCPAPQPVFSPWTLEVRPPGAPGFIGNTMVPHDGAAPIGAVVLRVNARAELPAGALAVIQAQDEQCEWQDVEGWGGPLAGGEIAVPVTAPTPGTGLYRWRIYTDAGERQDLWQSDAFYLPTRGGEVVVETSPFAQEEEQEILYRQPFLNTLMIEFSQRVQE